LAQEHQLKHSEISTQLARLLASRNGEDFEEFPCHQAFGCFFGTSASHPLLCQQPQCEQQLFSGAYEG